MRKLFFIISLRALLLLFGTAAAYAQVTDENSIPIETLFTQVPNDRAELSDPTALRDFQLYQIDPALLTQMLDRAYPEVRLRIPVEGAELYLELTKNEIFNGELIIETSSGERVAPRRSVHYRGHVAGDKSSFVALSLSPTSVVGVISRTGDNMVIGKMKRDQGLEGGYVIMYKEKDLNAKNPFQCFTEDQDVHGGKEKPQNELLTDCSNVPVYFECDHQMYLDNGSSTLNVIDYVTGVFNVVHTLYINESVHSYIIKIFIWTTADSYPTTNSLDALNSFRNTRTSYVGRLAHLLSTNTNNLGGRAWVNSYLCALSNYRYAYSNIDGFFNDFPTYSWDVEVIAHEMGHNLGSQHTQWCGWTGGALDNCVATEGGCPPGPAPTNGGTIMSYCHLVWTVGINFANGFGVQPGNAIRNVVSTSSACLAHPEDRYFQNTIQNGFVPLNYYVAGWIYAGRNVTSSVPVGDYVVNYTSPSNYGDVSFYAGVEIQLQNGFHAKNGSEFLARIDPHLNCLPSPLVTSVEEDEIVAEEKRLVSFVDAQPNPMSESGSVRFFLNASSRVSLTVNNVVGTEIVRLLDNEFIEKGERTVSLENLPSGMYIIMLRAGSELVQKSFVVVK